MHEEMKHRKGLEAAEKFRLAGLLDYQPDSVVSRTIIDKTAGTVTMFSFDAGQGLSEHTAPFDALVYMIDGKAEVTISGKKQILGDGDIVLMPAGNPHAIRAESPFKMLLIMIKERTV